VYAAALATILIGYGSTGQAQQQSPSSRPAMIPAKVDVVISRFKGEQKTASLPYTLMVNVNGEQWGQARTSIRMGVDVPVGTTTITRDGVTTTQPSYRNVGTNIDCQANSRDDGRYSVYVNIVDSSFVGGDVRTARTTDPAAFMTFTTHNNLIVRDGQTVQFTMATDKVSGDVVKVEVTLTLIK
jgi:hypothetical protein